MFQRTRHRHRLGWCTPWAFPRYRRNRSFGRRCPSNESAQRHSCPRMPRSCKTCWCHTGQRSSSRRLGCKSGRRCRSSTEWRLACTHRSTSRSRKPGSRRKMLCPRSRPRRKSGRHCRPSIECCPGNIRRRTLRRRKPGFHTEATLPNFPWNRRSARRWWRSNVLPRGHTLPIGHRQLQAERLIPSCRRRRSPLMLRPHHPSKRPPLFPHPWLGPQPRLRGGRCDPPYCRSSRWGSQPSSRS